MVRWGHRLGLLLRRWRQDGGVEEGDRGGYRGNDLGRRCLHDPPHERLLSFIPAALCGAAIIGAGGVVAVFDLASNIKVAVTFAVGAVVGYIAEWAGGMLTKKA